MIGMGLGLNLGRGRSLSPLYRSLVAAYEFESLLADSHTGGLALTNNNSVAADAGGKVGGAASFVAASIQSLSRADEAPLSGADTPMWGLAWVKPASLAANRAVFGKYNGGSSQREWLVRVLSTGAVTLQASSTGGGGPTSVSTAAGVVTAGNWAQLLWWHDPAADTVSVQVNAAAPVSGAHAGGIFNGTAAFRIGAHGTGADEPMDGLIDQVFFGKDYLLTAADRTFLYNGGAGRSYAELRAYSAFQILLDYLLGAFWRRFGRRVPRAEALLPSGLWVPGAAPC